MLFLLKFETVEFLSKFRIFFSINGNKKYPLKDMYRCALKHDLIIDNLQFSENNIYIR